MKYLLDTHVFLWLDNDPGRLSPKVAAICSDLSNTLMLSLISVWEMQIKVTLGKLRLPGALTEIVEGQIRQNKLIPLPLEFSHIWQVAKLPLHHKDPFDRLLIAQAIAENISLISDDSRMRQYSVKVIW